MSPVFEYRLRGALEAGLGVALLAFGRARDSGGAAFVPFLGFAAIFGGWMYLVAYRRYVGQAVMNPGSAPTTEREPATRTLRRAVLSLLVLAPVYALAVAATDAIFPAAILAGNGAAIWWAGNSLARRERETGERLLREPRWRMGGADRWFGGRGIMDARDFYVDD